MQPQPDPQNRMEVSDPPARIVLYDGVCGLCHWSVSWLLRNDRAGTLRFAPLQGETAAELRRIHSTIPDELESVVLVDDGRVHLRSKAFLYAARYLRRPWRWAYHLRWLPAPILDVFYRLIARVRYRVWGRYDSCRAPATEQRQRLLP